jgi:hypothetical protein
MHEAYRDIRSRVVDPPIWFDEHAVPRFVKFHPRYCSNIYADEAALVLVTCQCCGKEYRVAFTSGPCDKIEAGQRAFLYALEEIKHGQTVRGADLQRIKKESFERIWKSKGQLGALIRTQHLEYGDPPNTCDDDCAAGALMCSEPRRLLEYWQRYRTDENGKLLSLDWERDSSLEIEVEPDWVKEDPT